MQWGEWRQEHADGGGAWDGPAACGEWEAVQIHPTGGACPDPGSAKGKDPCHSDIWWVGILMLSWLSLALCDSDFFPFLVHGAILKYDMQL